MMAGTMIQALHPPAPASDRSSMSFLFSRTVLRRALRAERRRRLRRVELCLAVAILVLGCEPASDPAEPTQDPPVAVDSMPAPPPILLEAVSDAGHYRIRARPAELPLKLNRVHDWIVGIERLGDWSEVPTAIRFDGGMPSHGHGFVTRPRVTKNLGHGEFLVEGVKFHMAGDWVLAISVTSQTTTEGVVLPLTVEP
jgi:hypothetical protein